MKALQFRIWMLALTSALAILTVGCVRTDAIAAEGPAPGQETPAPAPAVDAPGVVPPPEQPPVTETTTSTNQTEEAKLVRTAEIPANLNVSPSLAEIIKLAQAGVGDAVMLAYVTNSPKAYYLGPDEIVYLNDLGVAPEVIAALIQQDNTPGSVEEKAAATAATTLPPELVLNTPASNVYPTNDPKSAPVPAEPAPQEPATAATPPPEDAPNVAYFYDSLAPYGNWVHVENYGLCWQPTVATLNRNWRPYGDRGRWLWTDSGWYWYSDYSWGWAPFHYGRWHTSPRLGWVWIPDRVWGPSWVTWRYTSSYCGWAPLPPYTYYDTRVGLTYGYGAVSVGFSFGLGYDHYNYVHWDHFHHRRSHLHYISGARKERVHTDSRAVNNYVVRNNTTIVNEGVGIEKVRGYTRAEINRVAIQPTREPQPGAQVRPERLIGSGRQATVTSPILREQPSRVRTTTAAGATSRTPSARDAALTPAAATAPSTQPAPPTDARRPSRTQNTITRPATPVPGTTTERPSGSSPAAAPTAPRPSRNTVIPASPTSAPQPSAAPQRRPASREPGFTPTGPTYQQRTSRPTPTRQPVFSSTRTQPGSQPQSSRPIRVTPDPQNTPASASPILTPPQPVTSSPRTLPPPTNPRAPGTPPSRINSTPSRTTPSQPRPGYSPQAPQRRTYSPPPPTQSRSPRVSAPSQSRGNAPSVSRQAPPSRSAAPSPAPSSSGSSRSRSDDSGSSPSERPSRRR